MYETGRSVRRLPAYPAYISTDLPACPNLKYHFHTEFDTSNAYYYRFITHLKFFALRLLKNNQFNEEEENELLDVVKDKYCASYECVLKIRDFLKRKYKYTLHEDEIVYLTIHVHRVVHKTKKE